MEYAKNWLLLQRPLSDRENEVGLIMAIHIRTCPENVVKIGPAHSEIIALQGDR